MSSSFVPTTNQFPANPMITISSIALGVTCFNSQAARAEIGYLDVHDLFISVSDSNGNTIIGPWASMANKDLEIISATTGIGEIYENQNSDANFSRIFELTEIYGTGADFANNAASKFQSRLYIHDAVFAAEPTTVVDAVAYEQDNPNSTKPSRRTGRILNVFSKHRDLRLRFGTREYTLDSNLSYQIIIKNGNCPATTEGDFKHYYDILKDAGNIRYNLRFPPATGHLPSSEVEQKQIEELSRQMIDVSKNSERSQEDRVELARQLEALAAIFRCTPAPCQKVAFADKSRAIPV